MSRTEEECIHFRARIELLNSYAVWGFSSRSKMRIAKFVHISAIVSLAQLLPLVEGFIPRERLYRMHSTEPRFGEELIRLTRRCRGIDKYVSSRAELTIDEMHCLSVLYTDHPPSVKRLSELINVSSTRASKILKDLEDSELVSRTLDADDRRKEVVVLTEGGLRAVQSIVSLYTEIGGELLTSWRTELASDFSWLLQVIAQPK